MLVYTQTLVDFWGNLSFLESIHELMRRCVIALTLTLNLLQVNNKHLRFERLQEGVFHLSKIVGHALL